MTRVPRWPSKELVDQLKTRALEARRFLVEHSVEHSTHLGGALSLTDILVALYWHTLRVRPREPDWQDRDLFILSKGHVGILLYYVLASKGYFPLEDLKTYEQTGAILSTHPSNKIPGVETTTGSLGHGLSVGAGMAIADKLDGKENRVFVVLGDGEIQEGSVWEAAMTASQYRLDNLVAILDRNHWQAGVMTESIMAVEPIDEKFKAFGWSTSIIDGHDMEQIVQTLGTLPFETGLPSVIVADTVKGKGVDFIENRPEAHVLNLSPQQGDQALKCLESAS